MQSKFLPFSALEAWLQELAANARLFVPQLEGEPKPGARSVPAVVYEPYKPGCKPELRRKATESAKRVIFPRSETLFQWKQARTEGGAETLSLVEPESEGKTVVFGLLSCDARGFLIFDPVYEGSGTEGKAKDPYYLRRRADTVLVVKACSQILNTCFCHWVGGGPASAEGADVLAHELAEGYLLTPTSEAGAALLASPLLQEGTAQQAQTAEAAGQAALQALQNLAPAPENMGAAPKALEAAFADLDFWGQESALCLSCRACTNLCPTCYCFNISDEAKGKEGTRLRNWDACMCNRFTLEASGHNPRSAKAARLRNRIGHKFSYYPVLHNGRIACCGCGRCIKSCPSSVDIRAIVRKALGKFPVEAGKEAGKATGASPAHVSATAQSAAPNAPGAVPGVEPASTPVATPNAAPAAATGSTPPRVEPNKEKGPQSKAQLKRKEKGHAR